MGLASSGLSVLSERGQFSSFRAIPEALDVHAGSAQRYRTALRYSPEREFAGERACSSSSINRPHEIPVCDSSGIVVSGLSEESYAEGSLGHKYLVRSSGRQPQMYSSQVCACTGCCTIHGYNSPLGVTTCDYFRAIIPNISECPLLPSQNPQGPLYKKTP